jgi:adhesin transport system outer membrane protein
MLDAIKQTLRTNPDVQIDVAKRMSTGEAVDQARSGYYPKIDLAVGRGVQRPHSATTDTTYGGAVNQNRYDRTLTISQMLFDGMGTQSEVERNQARTDSAAFKLAYTSEQIALKAIEAYLEVLRQQEIILLTKDNLEAHLRTADQIRLRASSGVGRKSDLDQIEARVALANSNLTAAEANLVVAKVNYKLIVGDLPGELDKPKPPDIEALPGTMEDAVKTAIEASPIIRSAQADLDAADAQYRSAKSFLYPRFDLELGLQKNDLVTGSDSLRDDNKYAMLRMRINLFKGGSDMARLRETIYLASEAKEVLERARRQLEQSVRLSWNAFKSARDRLPDLQKHADSSLLSRDAYNKQFSLGQRTLLDLLDTENEAFTSSSNFINGQYVELFSRYRVLADTGKLFDVLGLPHLEEAKTNYEITMTGFDALEGPARFRSRPQLPGEAALASRQETAVIETPAPEPVGNTLPPPPTSAAPNPASATTPLVIEVGRPLPTETADKLRERLDQLGFPIAKSEPSNSGAPAAISVGPYSQASNIAKDIARLDALGLDARLPKLPAEAVPSPIRVQAEPQPLPAVEIIPAPASITEKPSDVIQLPGDDIPALMVLGLDARSLSLPILAMEGEVGSRPAIDLAAAPPLPMPPADLKIASFISGLPLPEVASEQSIAEAVSLAIAPPPALPLVFIHVGRPLPAEFAERLYQRLRQLGFPVNPVGSDAAAHRQVTLGPYADEKEGAADLARLDDLGIAAALRYATPTPGAEP